MDTTTGTATLAPAADLDTCHCGAPLHGSDHCTFCFCEQFESTCDATYEPEADDDLEDDDWQTA